MRVWVVGYKWDRKKWERIKRVWTRETTLTWHQIYRYSDIRVVAQERKCFYPMPGITILRILP